MAAPRGNALALSSLMSPAGPVRTSQKRKAEDAGIEPFSAPATTPHSLDALSAVAAAAATTVEDSSQLACPPSAYDSGDRKEVLAPILSSYPAESHPGSGSQALGAPPPPPPAGTAYILDGNGDEGHYDDDGGIIRCICGCDDDDGFTVQCDRCLVWQHCACLKMTPDSLPDEYLCEQCFPRPVDVEYARELQQRRRADEARKEMEEQQRLAASLRRTSTTTQAAYPAVAAAHIDVHLASAVQPAAKESRGRKVSQSEPSAPDIDYFSGLAHGTATSQAASGKSAKRKTSTSASKSSKRPSAATMPAVPVELPPVPLPTPKESKPPQREDEDILDAQERFEAWQIEFTPVNVNLYSDRHTKALLDSVANAASTTKLRAFEVGTGKVMAPLADPAEEEADPPNPQSADADEDIGRGRENGLSVTGHECVPVEIEAKSLADVTQRATVRYIPDGVASGMFAQVQSAEPSPGMPQYAWSAHQNVPKPTMHGLYADSAISAGTFITEYRGEITDADEYRADPINQYHALGTPKPHVHIFPPPLNIAIDARRYGTEARFIRPSCHPNAVLRPILLRSSESEDVDRSDGAIKRETRELLFGIFAISDINRGHEITLGWEWDDLHIVHYLPELVKEPPRVSRRAVSPVKDAIPEPITFPYAGTAVAAKMEAVTSALCSVTLCACLGPASSNSSSAAAAAATYFNPTQLTQSNLRKQDCALAQMVRVAHGMELLQVIPSAKSHRKLRPPDFAPLIGRRRWWRPLPLPPTPASSTKADAEDRTHAHSHVTGSDLDRGMDVDEVDAASADGRSDDDEEMDRRSEASSLTEPLSDTFDGPDAAERGRTVDLSPSTAASKKDGSDDDQEDRPTILPLKKRVAGTRLKATYFDADFASDSSDGEPSDILSKSTRKHGGRLRTTSRSTRIAKDPRRRPLRSTPDPEDEAEDRQLQKEKLAKKMRQRREAKLQSRVRKPRKDVQPSSPLSSLSSQASLSSLDSENSEDDGAKTGHNSSSASSEDASDGSSDSDDTQDSDSDSESSSSDSSSSSSNRSPNRKKSKVQERARKRAAKFRADIAALGDSDTSSDDSAIPAGLRKSAAEKQAAKAHKRVEPHIKSKDRERSPVKASSKKSVEKRRTEESKRIKEKAERKFDSSQQNFQQKTGKEADKRSKKKTVTKAEDQPQDNISGNEKRQSKVARPRKPKLFPRPIESSSSESEAEQQPEPAPNSTTQATAAIDQKVAVPEHVQQPTAPAPSLAADAKPPSTELSVAKGDQDDSVKAETDLKASTLPEPSAQPAVMDVPKPEPPRKKLSLADYKRRMAEKKVVEVVPTPSISEDPQKEQAPTVGVDPVPDTGGAIEAQDEAVNTAQSVPEPPDARDEDEAPAIDSVVAPDDRTLSFDKSFDNSRGPLSPVKPRALSPVSTFGSFGATTAQVDAADRQPAPSNRSVDRGWSRVSSPSRDEEPEARFANRPPAVEPIQRPPGTSRWGDPLPDQSRARPTLLTGANAAPPGDRDAVGTSFGRGRSFGRPVPPSPSEDRMDVDQLPRYGGAIPSADVAKRDVSPTRPEHNSRSNATLGSAWQAVGNDRPRFGGTRHSDASDQARLGTGFRPATTVASSPENTRPELSIAGRAAAALGPNRIPLGGGHAIPTGPAGLQTFNPPRGPRALMGSSIMAPPGSTSPIKDATRLEPAPPAFSLGPNSQAPERARLSGSNAVPTTPNHAASGPNKIGGPSGAPSGSGSGWTRISVSNNPGAPSASGSQSAPGFSSDRQGPTSTPASLRADLMNFDGVPKGPASMRGESSGSSSYDDYEYFGGRDRGRGGWRGPRVRKRGGGRGRGWMRP